MRLSSRFSEALVYAAEAHGDQRRKISGEPYLAHLLGVAAIALEHGADEDEAIAALLHDAIEDQGGAAAREEIGRRFGPRVVEIVEGCTDTDRTPKPPWAERKRAHVAALAGASASVRLVSAADKLHNARALRRELRRQGAAVWDRFGGGRDGTLWYYRAVVGALRHSDGGAPVDELVDELDHVVGEIERLAAGDDRDSA